MKSGDEKSTASESSNKNLTNARTIKHYTDSLKTFDANDDKMDDKKENDVSKIRCDNSEQGRKMNISIKNQKVQ